MDIRLTNPSKDTLQIKQIDETPLMEILALDHTLTKWNRVLLTKFEISAAGITYNRRKHIDIMIGTQSGIIKFMYRGEKEEDSEYIEFVEKFYLTLKKIMTDFAKEQNLPLALSETFPDK